MSVNFADLGIEQKLIETLGNLNIVTPTPVQEKSIPHVLAGKKTYLLLHKLVREKRLHLVYLSYKPFSKRNLMAHLKH